MADGDQRNPDATDLVELLPRMLLMKEIATAMVETA